MKCWHLSHSLNRHAHLSSGPRGLNIGMGLYLRYFFVCAGREGSGETVRFSFHARVLKVLSEGVGL